MIILDASVIVKWIQEEKYSEEAKILREKHLKKEDEILIPKLLFYEVANALATKPSVKKGDVKIGLELIYATELKVFNESNEDIRKSAQLAKKYNTTFYDMLYAVIAKNKSCNLITADENFQKKTKFNFVRLLSEVQSS